MSGGQNMFTGSMNCIRALGSQEKKITAKISFKIKKRLRAETIKEPEFNNF